MQTFTLSELLSELRLSGTKVTALRENDLSPQIRVHEYFLHREGQDPRLLIVVVGPTSVRPFVSIHRESALEDAVEAINAPPTLKMTKPRRQKILDSLIEMLEEVTNPDDAE